MKVRESLPNDYEIRSVRGKSRGVPKVFADYQEEANGSLTFLGYTLNRSNTDFSAEVAKLEQRCLDFGHYYIISREYKSATNGGKGPFNYVVLKDGEYKIDTVAAGIRAGDHFEEYIDWSTYRDLYMPTIYSDHQKALKDRIAICMNQWKGDKDSYSNEEDEEHKSIRGETTSWNGDPEDWQGIDLVTETCLLLVAIFDEIDTDKINDDVKLDLVRFAADTVAKRRFGDAVGHSRLSLKGAVIVRKASKTNLAERLIADMANYAEGHDQAPDDDHRQYNSDLDDLRNNMSDKTGYDPDEGSVKARLRTAKKRGGGYTTFKTMPAKYRSEHPEIDDSNW